MSLVLHHAIPGRNILATTVDSEDDCYDKYPEDAENFVKQLRDAGALIAFGVDATALHKSRDVRSSLNGWNKVVFNFPHVGKEAHEYLSYCRRTHELLSQVPASKTRIAMF